MRTDISVGDSTRRRDHYWISLTKRELDVLQLACLFRAAKINPWVSFFFDEHGYIHIHAVEY